MKSFDIKVGKGRSALSIDAAKLVDGCALIQGTRGSGKSYLARVIVEQTIPKGLQTIILDPEGEFATLREKFDLLVAGVDGDVPVELRSAKLLARRIAETGVSAVVDLSDLKLDTRRDYVKLFLETLDSLPKKLERPRLVILDEAHRFAPESGKGKATSTEAVVTLLSQGRKRGLGAILITQRLSKLRKDAAAEAANLFIGKTSPIDLPTAQDLLGVTKREREELRRLEPGVFYATGPALSAVDVEHFTARRSETTHPEPGSRHELSTPPPRNVIKKILKDFEKLQPEPPPEPKQTPGAVPTLELRNLKRDLRDMDQAFQKQAVKLERVDGERKALQNRLTAVIDLVGAKLPVMPTAVDRGRAGATRPPPSPPAPYRPAPSPRPTTAPSVDDELGAGAPRKLLSALITYAKECPTSRAALMAGLSPKSSTFRNAQTTLRRKGLMTSANGEMTATEYAYSEYGANIERLPPPGPELISYWTGKLGEGAPKRLFETLVGWGGEAGSREQAAVDSDLSPTSSTFRNAMTKLRRLGLMTDSGSDIGASQDVLR